MGSTAHSDITGLPPGWQAKRSSHRERPTRVGQDPSRQPSQQGPSLLRRRHGPGKPLPVRSGTRDQVISFAQSPSHHENWLSLQLLGFSPCSAHTASASLLLTHKFSVAVPGGRTLQLAVKFLTHSSGFPHRSLQSRVARRPASDSNRKLFSVPVQRAAPARGSLNPSPSTSKPDRACRHFPLTSPKPRPALPRPAQPCPDSRGTTTDPERHSNQV